MLTGVLAELLVVQALVLAELANGPLVTGLLVLAQRRCELTLDRVLRGGSGCCCRFHLPLEFGLRQRSNISGKRQCGEVDGYAFIVFVIVFARMMNENEK